MSSRLPIVNIRYYALETKQTKTNQKGPMQTSGVDGYVYCLHCSDNNTGVHLCPTHQTVYITYM